MSDDFINCLNIRVFYSIFLQCYNATPKPLRVNNKLSWECKLRIGGEVNTIADWLKRDPQKLYDRFTVNKVNLHH